MDLLEYIIEYIAVRLMAGWGPWSKKELITFTTILVLIGYFIYSQNPFIGILSSLFLFLVRWISSASFLESWATYSYMNLTFNIANQFQLAFLNTDNWSDWRLFGYNLISLTVGTLIIASLRQWIKKKTDQNQYWSFLDKIVLVLGIIGDLTTSVSVSTTLSQAELASVRTLAQLNTVFFFLYSVVFIAIVAVFIRTTIRQIKLDQDQASAESMLRYNEIVESSSREIRKFKHDYSNIMLGLAGYIEEDDFDGLKHYYYDQISPKVDDSSLSNFQLDRLSYIHCPPLKALLAEKIVTALGQDIKLRLEISQDINDIYIPEMDLVRMMGIILDNAIEEIQSLDEGTLTVAIFPGDKTLDIIVQNTARPNKPSLKTLQQEGHSTKGSGRGYGLSNLQEIANRHPNLLLETHYDGQLFTQHLTLTEEENAS